jgi:hypothetical protein
MTVRPPFETPANVRRPHGAFRFDVLSLKAKRRLTLYGWASLQGWIDLETDSGVDRLCERPLVVKDVKPQRVVDFWASGPGRNELIFLLRPGEISESGRTPFNPGFETWAAEAGCVIRQIPIEKPSIAKERWLNDWAEVLQCIASYQGLITSTLVDRVGSKLSNRCRLIDVVGSVNVDPDLVRAVAYSLVCRGSHRFVDLASSGLDAGLELEPV